MERRRVQNEQHNQKLICPFEFQRLSVKFGVKLRIPFMQTKIRLNYCRFEGCKGQLLMKIIEFAASWVCVKVNANRSFLRDVLDLKLLSDIFRSGVFVCRYDNVCGQKVGVPGQQPFPPILSPHLQSPILPFTLYCFFLSFCAQSSHLLHTFQLGTSNHLGRLPYFLPQPLFDC